MTFCRGHIKDIKRNTFFSKLPTVRGSASLICYHLTGRPCCRWPKLETRPCTQSLCRSQRTCRRVPDNPWSSCRDEWSSRCCASDAPWRPSSSHLHRQYVLRTRFQWGFLGYISTNPMRKNYILSSSDFWGYIGVEFRLVLDKLNFGIYIVLGGTLLHASCANPPKNPNQNFPTHRDFKNCLQILLERSVSGNN